MGWQHIISGRHNFKGFTEADGEMEDTQIDGGRAYLLREIHCVAGGGVST